MFSIEAHSEVGKTRPIMVYYVNKERAGTTVRDVNKKLPSGIPRKLIAIACEKAKWESPTSFTLAPSMMGWSLHK